jgi:AcrR family transcriptional regulator
MGRWEPNASGRLRAAALELYVERGYEQTTVAEIAARAGLTARTFFRHFADKREVLFAGSPLQDALVSALDAAPDSATPMEAVAAALGAASEMLTDQEYSRRRQLVINANAELLERELIKLATMSAALADGLRGRGVPDPAARLAAETGIAVFRVAFERWVGEAEDRSLARVLRESFDELRALTAAGERAGPTTAGGPGSAPTRRR